MLALVVPLDAVAFATLLRPRHGYTSIHPLLVVLALGTGVGLAALTAVAAIVAIAANRARRSRISLWDAMTVRKMAIVLAIFVAAAVSSQLIRAIGPAATSQDNAAGADFRRWQEQVIPIVVTYTSALREDRVLIHGLPPAAGSELRQRVARSEQTLSRLARTVAAEAPQLPARPELRRLTGRLETALALAVQAQRSYSLALAAAAHTTRRDVQVRRLATRGRAELQRSQMTMAAFSFDANNLGATLFAGSP